MTGNLWGADVAQLRTLAQQFGKASESLHQQSTLLTSQINNNSAWKGNDALQFRSDWNGNHHALLQRAADRLKEESKKLLENANQQEKASDAAPGSGGGPLGGSGSGDSGTQGGPFQLGPDWLADKDGPFRKGWDVYNTVKAFPNIRAGVYDFPHFVKQASTFGEFISKDFREVAKSFQDTNALSKLFNTSSELFDGKWHTAFSLAEGGKAATFFDVGGKALGGLGVGLDVLDVVNHASKGEVGAAVYSGAKAFIGAASFIPPPVGTAFMVVSAGLAIYDNVPAVKNFVNGVGAGIADGATAVWDGAGDAADKVGDFFGF